MARFGLTANIEFFNIEFKGIVGTKYDLPGTSNSITNASVFYENNGFSARVNYQFRESWISPIESPDEVWGDETRVDLSVSYELPLDLNGASVSIYANANNLTNETDKRYDGNGLVNQSESYGRYYLMGLRVNY